MRTGAIFARGSCRALSRALKWIALVGVVTALGAGQAAAQVKVSGSAATGFKANEGGRVMVTVSADIRVGIDQADDQTWAVPAPTASTDGITVDHAKMLTPAETTAPVDFVLPAAAINVTVPGNPSTVTPLDTTLSATFTIQLQSDGDAEDEVFNLVFAEGIATSLASLSSVTQKGSDTAIATPDAAARTRKVTINDTDNQDFIWDVTTSSPKENVPIVATLKAMPPPAELEYDVAMSVDTTGYTVTPTTFQFDAEEATAGVDGPMATLTITPPKSDRNRTTDIITVNAITAGTVTSLVAPLEIEVADLHALPAADKISAKAYTDDDGKASKVVAMSVTEGGDPVHVTVTADRGSDGYPMDEKLKVSVMGDASQALDFRVDPATFEIGSGTGKRSATFKLWALKDDDVGAEELMLHLKVEGATTNNGSGEVMPTPMFKIAIEDDTAAKVWAKDGAMKAVYDARDAAAGADKKINPGEKFEIMTDDLFGHLPTVTVAYGASSDNSAVGVSASGEKIMVMPQDMEGTAKITITATATDKAASFKTSQDRSDIAHIMFEVDVMLGALTYSVMGPENRNLVEGMDHANGTKASAMVKVMASRALTGDETAKVMLMRDGASSASMDDFTVMPEMVMLKAGDMEAEFKVMAVADDMMENDGNMAEMLTLFAVVNDMQMTDESVMFYLWDAAVPALPIIAQLLLAGLLGVGGYRRYRRR